MVAIRPYYYIKQATTLKYTIVYKYGSIHLYTTLYHFAFYINHQILIVSKDLSLTPQIPIDLLRKYTRYTKSSNIFNFILIYEGVKTTLHISTIFRKSSNKNFPHSERYIRISQLTKAKNILNVFGCEHTITYE